MNPELERLIDFALADGILTDKEKEILYKKAKGLDVDIDEFEMILNGKLHIKQKEMQQEANLKIAPTSPPSLPSQQQTNKEGDIKKCPSCGAPVNSFTSKCNECGHEFRNIAGNKSATSLFQLLTEAEDKIRTERLNLKGVYNPAIQTQMAIGTAQATIINSFPVPNSKEDILEFLSLTVPKVKNIKKGFFSMWSDPHHFNQGIQSVNRAWADKCSEVIIKGRFLFKDDKEVLNELNFYAKQLGI